MKISARNVFEGQVVAIKEGPVSAEVDIVLPTGETLVAAITEGSVHSLGLRPGLSVMAFVKAPLVLLATDTAGWRFSARNQLAGTVSQVLRGAVNASVQVRLAGGAEISAIITHGAVDELALAPGLPVTALFKAGSVLLGVKDA